MKTSEAQLERSLARRCGELERQLAESNDGVRLLSRLHAAYARIAGAHDEPTITAELLRAARDPLGFRRAVFFALEAERSIAAVAELDRSDVVEASVAEAFLGPGSAILAALRSERALLTGSEGELSAPLIDVRGWYALAALPSAIGPLGLVYLDDHAAPAPLESASEPVRDLALIAGVALHNARLFARTQELANRDPLTGLLNRRALHERLLAAIEQARARGRSLTYAMIDLDDFKRVNDTYGHAAGDEVLRRVGETLLRGTRDDDLVARYAGDEFVALFFNVDVRGARGRVGRLSEELRAAGLRCSIGAACFPSDARDAAELLAAADRALYVAKASGKNGVAFA
ncbi:MAG: diguanylate cyclase [Vulcanimicrobiaceae bacterium]